MAQYKVPQDVEADDKLLGPFNFRQFVYLMIMVGGIALAVALFQVFPFLALIPVPVIIFFAVLALPLKRDQPMEAYLAAIVSYHLKPKKRTWIPGQRESTILITAPKQTEDNRTRNLSGEEASRRLSFLANVVDSEGYSVKDNTSTMQDSFLAEAQSAKDILDDYSSPVINQMIAQHQTNRHDIIVEQMRMAIAGQTTPQVAPQAAPQTPPQAASAPQSSSAISPPLQKTTPGAQSATNNIPQPPTAPSSPQKPASRVPIQNQSTGAYSFASSLLSDLKTTKQLTEKKPYDSTLFNSSVVIRPDPSVAKRAAENKAKLASLAYQDDLTVATIAQQAARIEKITETNNKKENS